MTKEKESDTTQDYEIVPVEHIDPNLLDQIVPGILDSDQGDIPTQKLTTDASGTVELVVASDTVQMEAAAADFREEFEFPDRPDKTLDQIPGLPEEEAIEHFPQFEELPLGELEEGQVLRLYSNDETSPEQDFLVLACDELGVYLIPFPFVIRHAIYKAEGDRGGYILNQVALRKGESLEYGFGFDQFREVFETSPISSIRILGEAGKGVIGPLQSGFEEALEIHQRRKSTLLHEGPLPSDKKKFLPVQDHERFRTFLRFRNPQLGDVFHVRVDSKLQHLFPEGVQGEQELFFQRVDFSDTGAMTYVFLNTFSEDAGASVGPLKIPLSEDNFYALFGSTIGIEREAEDPQKVVKTVLWEQ